MQVFTDFATEQQIKAGLWRTSMNQLIEWEGKLIYVKRSFVTDNITFISCDFADVRASHFHDVGCKYHEIIIVDLTIHQLLASGMLQKIKNSEYYTCADIPLRYLHTEKISFRQCNKLFKDILLACNENKLKTWLMFVGVNLNANWWIKIWRHKIKHIDLSVSYGEDW